MILCVLQLQRSGDHESVHGKGRAHIEFKISETVCDILARDLLLIQIPYRTIIQTGMSV